MDLPGSRGYHDKVIDHYENPRNVGSLDKNDINVGTGLVGAPACGDVMKLQVGPFFLNNGKRRFVDLCDATEL